MSAVNANRLKHSLFWSLLVGGIALVGLPSLSTAADVHIGGGGGGGHADGGAAVHVGGGGGAHINAGGTHVDVGGGRVAPRANVTVEPRTYPDRVARPEARQQTRYYRGDQAQERYYRDQVIRNNRRDDRSDRRWGYAPYLGWGYGGYYTPWNRYGYGNGYYPGYGNGYYDNGYDNGYDYSNYDRPTPAGGGAFLGVTFDSRYPDAAVIGRIYADSPAQAAGLKPGDEITSINGLHVRSGHDVTAIVSQMDPGTPAQIRLAGPSPRTVEATLAAR